MHRASAHLYSNWPCNAHVPCNCWKSTTMLPKLLFARLLGVSATGCRSGSNSIPHFANSPCLLPSSKGCCRHGLPRHSILREVVQAVEMGFSTCEIFPHLTTSQRWLKCLDKARDHCFLQHLDMHNGCPTSISTGRWTFQSPDLYTVPLPFPRV